MCSRVSYFVEFLSSDDGYYTYDINEVCYYLNFWLNYQLNNIMESDIEATFFHRIMKSKIPDFHKKNTPNVKIHNFRRII
ncbi:PIR Superfamily Protein [Plasmodium ovale curtisi]|uniref:PIR Superfamily Protein n=1 Tax=Plasmodium ovale curtisi TaxID=864141 RepID=A0A1A8WCC6_PLAOA|nr:PIR Superfamily Protein [Plasmodium ovale curtisi]SBS99506.1 PIR Superfamily Protein [Plasmodium ovale curtisi]